MTGKPADHYFSSLFAQVPTCQRTRDSGFPLRLSLPTVAPGQTPGALRFVSLALHILPHKGERHRRYVSARNVSEPYSSGNPVSLKLDRYSSTLAHTPTRKLRH